MSAADPRLELKRAAARRAAELVRDGMLLGLGTGSTADLWLVELAARVRAGLRVSGVPTSRRTERLAQQAGIPLATLEEHQRLDLTVDGADEVERQSLNLIKGRGGALLREKLVAAASDQRVIVVDDSKLVPALGRGPLPVEVVPFGWRQTAANLERLGCQASLRQADGRPFVSDEGHYVLDCYFGAIPEPVALAVEIKALVGVVEHGLFIELADRVVVAGSGGIEELTR